jgi:hypothetical protein
MDNKKGKKGKLFFYKIFVIDYVLTYHKLNKLIETELVTDNAKGKKGK